MGFDAVGEFEESWVLFLSVFERIGNMSKRYSQGFKDRAVRMVSERLSQDGSCSQWRAVSEIAPRLAVAVESLESWYEQSLVHAGQRPGLTREEHAEIRCLERENAELRRANEILKTASAFSQPSSARFRKTRFCVGASIRLHCRSDHIRHLSVGASLFPQ